MFRIEQARQLKPSTKLLVAIAMCVLLFAGTQTSSSSDPQSSVSWYSWLTGKTLSYDFHYLDLLELLYRSHDSSQE